MQLCCSHRCPVTPGVMWCSNAVVCFACFVYYVTVTMHASYSSTFVCFACFVRCECCLSNTGRQSTGPIPAFLRPLPPSQPEEEAKAQAASLAATAAAAAKQQEVTLQGVVQVCLIPEAEVPEGKALPALEKPFLNCPAQMHVQELQKVPSSQLNSRACSLLSLSWL